MSAWSICNAAHPALPPCALRPKVSIIAVRLLKNPLGLVKQTCPSCPAGDREHVCAPSKLWWIEFSLFSYSSSGANCRFVTAERQKTTDNVTSSITGLFSVSGSDAPSLIISSWLPSSLSGVIPEEQSITRYSVNSETFERTYCKQTMRSLQDFYNGAKQSTVPFLQRRWQKVVWTTQLCVSLTWERTERKVFSSFCIWYVLNSSAWASYFDF